MSEQAVESKNVFTYKPTSEGCCDIFMGSTDTEEVIRFPAEIDGLRVTGIGYCACQNCQNAKVVIIPEGVTRIHSFAFSGCQKLVRIHLPSTLERISTMDLFYNNSLSIITCRKDNPRTWQLDTDYLPPKKVIAIRSMDPGKEDETGTVGIYTELPCETDLEILYERKFFIRTERYAADKGAQALAEVKKSYELICETIQTYDVYSSDGVDPNDRDEKTETLDIKLENLVFSKDGVCSGIFYKDKSFEGILFFDGTSVGAVSYADRKLCGGHPLDFYINTYRHLILKKKQA